MLRTYFYLDLNVPIELEAYRYLESYGENRASAVRHCFIASWLINGSIKPRQYMQTVSVSVIDPEDECQKKIILRWNCDLDDDPIVNIANNASSLRRSYRAPYLTKMLISGFEVLTGKMSLSNSGLIANATSPTLAPVAAIQVKKGPEIEPIQNTEKQIKTTKKDFGNLMGKRS